MPRADAQRNVAAILDAAVDVLGARPDASMEDVARAAGVTRQIVYAHFASRDALIVAVGERALHEAVDAFEAAALGDGSAVAALERLIDVSFTVARCHRLFDLRFPALSPEEQRSGHAPFLEPLEALIRRGQEAGEFGRDAPVGWLSAAFIALSHAAAEEMSAGRLELEDATQLLKRSVLDTFGATGSRPAEA